MTNEANKQFQGMTFKDIYTSTYKNLAKWRQNYPNVERIVGVKVTPYFGAKSLLFSAEVMSRDRKRHYKVYVQFFDIDFSDTPKSGDYAMAIYKQKKFYFKKPSLFKNKCRIRCGCEDFRHRFAWENRKYQCLYGTVPKGYKRKTPPPPKGRPYVNPKHTPGMCYHIYDVVKALESKYVGVLQ